MRKHIIKDRRIVEDSWQRVADDPAAAQRALIPVDGDVIVPLGLWQRARQALLDPRSRLGVWVDATTEPELFAADLPRFALLAIHIPSFSDGRAYSLGRLVRERLRYTGELRAIGDVRQDQLFYLARCGFNAFELVTGSSLQAGVAALSTFSHPYQGAADNPWPLFRQRRPMALKEAA